MLPSVWYNACQTDFLFLGRQENMRKRVRVYGRRAPVVVWGLILFAAIACWSLYSAGEQGMYAPQPAKEAHSGELPWN